MNDTYSELLIKKEATAKDKMIKVLLIALIALMAVAGLLITPLAFIVAIALGIAAYFVFPNLDLEFEYVYVNGELDNCSFNYVNWLNSVTQNSEYLIGIGALNTQIYLLSDFIDDPIKKEKVE